MAGANMTDTIEPDHYRKHPSGVDCIEITEHMNFNLGNAYKYIWRAGLKGEEIEDLQKAAWYIEREIKRLGCMKRRAEYKEKIAAEDAAILGRGLDWTDEQLVRALAAGAPAWKPKVPGLPPDLQAGDSNAGGGAY